MVATRLSAAVTLLLVLALAQCAGAFSGSLTNSTGIVPKDGWSNGTTSIDWTVTFASGYWNYHYTIVVPQTDISHFILETSPNFTAGDVKNLIVYRGQIGSYSVSTFEAPPIDNPDKLPNPYMPENIHGIKFDNTQGLTLEFSFDSTRRPVWGDFYGKGGSKNAIFNSSFAAADPTDPASDGSLNGHILVPDTIVPEPASILAFASGLLGLFLRRRTA